MSSTKKDTAAKHDYSINDLVFAKVKGHPSWPAKIIQIDKDTYKHIIKYKVNFFGTNETNCLSKDDICHYKENKEHFSLEKVANKYKNNYRKALSEINKVLDKSIISHDKKKNYNIVNNPLKTPTPSASGKLSTSTPKSIQTSPSVVSFYENKSDPEITMPNKTQYVNKSINTSDDIDLKFQLTAITDRCIELERTLLEKEQINKSVSEIDCKVAPNLKQDEKEKPDFHTQILLDELKKYKLEVDNLNKIVELLEKDKTNLERKIQEINKSNTACMHCFPVRDSGSTGNSNRSKRPRNTTNIIPTSFQIPTINRFNILSVENEEEPSSDEIVLNMPLKKSVQKNKGESPKKVSHKSKKMLLCTDSHGRDLTWYLSTNDQIKGYEVVGFVKPNGCAKQVLDPYNIKGEQIENDDILVIVCGTNDVAANEAHNALDTIGETLDKFRNLKVILVDLPMRYDLKDWSCVNMETVKTNATLKCISQKYSNVRLVEVSKAKRELHTQHGMHLNRRGKKWLAEQISEAALVEKQSEPQTESLQRNTTVQEAEVSIVTTNDGSNVSLQQSTPAPAISSGNSSGTGASHKKNSEQSSEATEVAKKSPEQGLVRLQPPQSPPLSGNLEEQTTDRHP